MQDRSPISACDSLSLSVISLAPLPRKATNSHLQVLFQGGHGRMHHQGVKIGAQILQRSLDGLFHLSGQWHLETDPMRRLCWHQHPPQLANLDAGRRKQIGFSNVFPLTSRSHRKAIRLSERLRACIGQGPHTEPQPNCRTRTLCQMEGQLFHTVSIPLRFRPVTGNRTSSCFMQCAKY